MKLSIAVTNYSWADDSAGLAARLVELAHTVDGTGLDTMWVADHLLQMDPNAAIDEPMLEAYTTLGFLAATTRSVGLGTMVMWALIRPPALVVKMVTTLDVLSGGRAWLSVGAGYQADEAAMTGLPFEATAERFVRLEELLQLARHMWAGDRRPFHGARHHLEQPINSPPPVSRPRMLVGGMGEQRTLPLVVRYADAATSLTSLTAGPLLRRKLDVLARACDGVGRDPGEIEVTVSSRLTEGETAGQFTGRCADLARLGVDHVVLVTTSPWHTGGDLDVVLVAVGPVAQIERKEPARAR